MDENKAAAVGYLPGKVLKYEELFQLNPFVKSVTYL